MRRRFRKLCRSVLAVCFCLGCFCQVTFSHSNRPLPCFVDLNPPPLTATWNLRTQCLSSRSRSIRLSPHSGSPALIRSFGFSRNQAVQSRLPFASNSKEARRTVPLRAFLPSLGIETSSSSASTELLLNGVRAVASALFTYTSLTAFTDRPRGRLDVLVGADLCVQPSTVPGAGLGLFAARDLGRGTVLGTYPGVVVPLRQHVSKLSRVPHCEGYIWRFSDNAMVIDPTDGTGALGDACIGGNSAQWASEWLFRSLLPFWTVSTALCRINEPPRGFDVNVVTDECLSDRTVTFALERDVFRGEELFIDYGLYYDRSRYGRTPDR